MMLVFQKVYFITFFKHFEASSPGSLYPIIIIPRPSGGILDDKGSLESSK